MLRSQRMSDRFRHPPLAQQSKHGKDNVMPRRISIIGHRFERLLVIGDGPRLRNPDGTPYLTSVCTCSCGQTVTVRNSTLRTGETRSCGCLSAESRATRTLKHGMSRKGNVHPVFQVWNNMIQRCTIPTHQSYQYYGGRGIRVCERWVNSPQAFLEDVGERPIGMTFDRTDNSGHYSCGQCFECRLNDWPANWRWVTQSRQLRNYRRNVILTVNGATGCLTDLCERFNADRTIVWQRLKKLKWSVERAFNTPKVWSKK